jgi:hypothetical protein
MRVKGVEGVVEADQKVVTAYKVLSIHKLYLVVDLYPELDHLEILPSQKLRRTRRRVLVVSHTEASDRLINHGPRCEQNRIKAPDQRGRDLLDVSDESLGIHNTRRRGPHDHLRLDIGGKLAALPTAVHSKVVIDQPEAEATQSR